MRGKLAISLWVAAGVLAAASLAIHWHTSRYDYLISQAAARNNLDFYLVKSIIHEESWFRPRARGSAGEVGLMQITRAAAQDFSAHKGFPALSEERLLEPALNLEIGCWYLRKSLDRYRKTPQPALFALLRYNAGESRADIWLKEALKTPPPAGISPEEHYLAACDFPKTRAYARRILQRARTHNFWY